MEGHFIIFRVVQDLEHDLKHVLQLLALGGGEINNILASPPLIQSDSSKYMV
jgi:hypothetical protein